jgi:hypothetical protein
MPPGKSAPQRKSLTTGETVANQTQLPDKKLLQTKLHEFYLQNANDLSQTN